MCLQYESPSCIEYRSSGSFPYTPKSEKILCLSVTISWMYCFSKHQNIKASMPRWWSGIMPTISSIEHFGWTVVLQRCEQNNFSRHCNIKRIPCFLIFANTAIFVIMYHFTPYVSYIASISAFLCFILSAMVRNSGCHRWLSFTSLNTFTISLLTFSDRSWGFYTKMSNG